MKSLSKRCVPSRFLRAAKMFQLSVDMMSSLIKRPRELGSTGPPSAQKIAVLEVSSPKDSERFCR